jgi:hypothetical protein
LGNAILTAGASVGASTFAGNVTGNVTGNIAGSAAGTVVTTASTALNTANTAVTNAGAAQSTANTAVTNAGAAQSTANTAVTNAGAAQSTANTAVTNAGAAQSTANTAITNAAAAQATANTAVTNASTALTDLPNKLNKTAADILTGPITLNALNAILVGTTNDGLYLGNTGLVGRKAGANTFAIDAAGNAFFKGDIGSGSSITAPVINGGTVSAATINSTTINSTTINGGTINGTTGTFDGVLNAGTVNAVSTFNLAGESITIPRGDTVPDGTTVPGTEATYMSVALNSLGQPIFVSFTAVGVIASNVNNNGSITLRVYVNRNGSTTRYVEYVLGQQINFLFGQFSWSGGILIPATTGTTTITFTAFGSRATLNAGTSMFAIGLLR